MAKKLGKNLVTAAIPEIGQVIAGKKKIKTAAKDSVKKSISESLVAQPFIKPAGEARWVRGPQRVDLRKTQNLFRPSAWTSPGWDR